MGVVILDMARSW